MDDLEAWLAGPYAKARAAAPERKPAFRTTSGIEIQPLYGGAPDGGFPGRYPFTRGARPTMYRGQLWTMRQYAGFSSARETNRRFKSLLASGQTGLSTAFDLPTQIGYDSDHPLAKDEAGLVGVPVNSLRDVERLFEGIPLGEVSTSMTINATACILLALYCALARKQGVPLAKLRGTVQNDVLKEYAARGNYRFPAGPSMRLCTDLIAWASAEAPQWNPISISGYHIREAGSSAVQELAFTLYDGLTYVQSAIESGLRMDDFAPRLSFFFNAHNDFFEEIAKYRAARRLWAREMKNRFAAKDPAALALRFHAQTAGCALTAQQPYNNVVRVALQALAGILGGAQSLHTNSLDETLALPTEEAVKLALRTQQIIAHESGVTHTIDPLGGAYYVEWLTNRLESEALGYFTKLDEMGGMIRAIELGYPQSEIQREALSYQKEIDSGERFIVGVNAFTEAERTPVKTLRISQGVERRQIQELRNRKRQRSERRLRSALNRLERVAEEQGDLMAPVMNAVRSEATVGEICDVFRKVYGEYRETGTI